MILRIDESTALYRRLAEDERGSMTSGFLVTALIAAIAIGIVGFSSHALATSMELTIVDSAIARVAQETCTQIYAAAQDPSTNAILRSYAGGTFIDSVPEVSGTPLPVTVKIAAASQGNVAVDLSANGVSTQSTCPVPSPKPIYNSTVTLP